VGEGTVHSTGGSSFQPTSKVSSRAEWSQHPVGGEHEKLATRPCYGLTKGKGWSKKLSKKCTGPYTIIEVRSPQGVVLKEPNSRNRFTINNLLHPELEDSPTCVPFLLLLLSMILRFI
jgi:hypothetical protein